MRTRTAGLALIVMLGACGDSGDPAAGEALAIDPAVIEADEPHAAAAVLQHDDLPGPWAVEDGMSMAEAPDVAECAEVDRSVARGRTATADSKVFRSDNQEVANTVSLYVDAAAASEAFEARVGEPGRRCLEALTAASLEADAAADPEIPAGSVEISVSGGELSVEPVGDQRRGLSLIVEVSVGPATLPGFADVVVVRVGRVVVDFWFRSMLEPFAGPRLAILEAGIERVERATDP